MTSWDLIGENGYICTYIYTQYIQTVADLCTVAAFAILCMYVCCHVPYSPWCIYRALTTFMPTLLTATTTHALTLSHKVRMLSYNASHCLCAPMCVCVVLQHARASVSLCACYLRGNVWFRMGAVGLCCIVLQYQYPWNCTIECFIICVCLLWPCTQDHWRWQRMTFGAWSLNRRAMSLWWSQGEVHRRKTKGCM